MSLKLYRKSVDTPVGLMEIIASNKGVCFVEFQIQGRKDLLGERLARWYGDSKEIEFIPGENEGVRMAGIWLEKYFAKDFSHLQYPSFDLRGTDFELRTWERLMAIPTGKTVSYGQLAEQLGNPGAARAVGNCTRRNPVAIIIPCHRVIGSSGSLTGYGGGLENKRFLLAHENATLI